MISNVKNNSMVFVHDNLNAFFITGKDELVYKSIIQLTSVAQSCPTL